MSWAFHRQQKDAIRRALRRLPLAQRVASLRRLSFNGPKRKRRTQPMDTTPPTRPADTPPKDRCDSCGCPMAFATNLDTGKPGPLDLRATVYVVVRTVLADPAKPAAPWAGWTARKFLERVAEIRMKDGTVLDPEQVRIHVSHFTTCPEARQHSRNKYQGKRA